MDFGVLVAMIFSPNAAKKTGNFIGSPAGGKWPEGIGIDAIGVSDEDEKSFHCESDRARLEQPGIGLIPFP
jgi:hypothetical protein